MGRRRSRGKRGRAGAGTVAGALAVAATVVALLLAVRNVPACDPAPAGTHAGKRHTGSSC
ncbi:hypothetical protein OIE71_23815 [Streptomyces sp. NBC_01725]|uniref:hypothetical protein n=1 Tax=Streptomyces sp. NBC_01725 TaxID=2975923 RepID=UPI002E2879A1|nr:hypothetical protein [Streptomyces sp. NBC_01725]